MTHDHVYTNEKVEFITDMKLKLYLHVDYRSTNRHYNIQLKRDGLEYVGQQNHLTKKIT